MSLSVSLQSAVSGIKASQQELRLISENVSNANTPGYSRKIANRLDQAGGGGGVGVRLSEIFRRSDVFLNAELYNATALRNQEDIARSFYERLEFLFGQGEGDIASQLEKLIARSLDASNDQGIQSPENALTQVRAVVQTFNRIDSRLQTFEKEIEGELSSHVAIINESLRQLEKTNQAIERAGNQGTQRAALIDERDRLLLGLSGEVKFQTLIREKGTVAIYAGGIMLLDHKVRQLAVAGKGATLEITTDGQAITSQIQGGALAGLLNLRHVLEEDFRAPVDDLARALHDRVNAQHARASAFPPPSRHVSQYSFADPSTEGLELSGQLRFALTDSSGRLAAGQRVIAIDLDDFSAQNPGAPTPQALVAFINEAARQQGASALRAEITSDGQLAFTSGQSGLGVLIDDRDSQVTAFIAADGSRQPLDHTQSAPGFLQGLGFNNLLTLPGYRPSETNARGAAGGLALRADISRENIATAEVNLSLQAQPDTYLITSADRSFFQGLAAALQEPITVPPASSQRSLLAASQDLILRSATIAAQNQSDFAFRDATAQALRQKVASVAEVNIDEELAHMILVQQSYASSARVLATVQELFSVLDSVLR